MTQQELQALMRSFEATTLTRLEYEEKGLRLVLERAALPGTALGGAVAPLTAAPVAPIPVALASSGGNEGAEAVEAGSYIKAPVVGTFYIASSPEAAPFVNAGSTVKKGDTVCILEAMKMINEVAAPCDCLIEEVLLADGALAGFGDSLFRIREL